MRVDVLASKGHQPITDLTTADFEVRDQGTPQRIDFIRFEELPLNIGVVCDMSLSVAGDDAVNIKRAVRSLIPNLRQGDRVSMITFGDRVTERLTLTDDVGSLRGALASVSPDGLTPLIDAVYAGTSLVGPEPGRSLVLVFSNGIDTASLIRPAQLLETEGQPRNRLRCVGWQCRHTLAAGGYRHVWRSSSRDRVHPEPRIGVLGVSRRVPQTLRARL